MNFNEIALDEELVRAVEYMGFEQMSPIQEQAIPALLAGKDIIGQAQTGTGKTAAFGIPMIQNVDSELKRLQGIVLCPTRELAMQAAEEIRKLAKFKSGIKVLPVYGGQDISRQIKALSQGVQIVVGTPGRVMDHMRRHTIKTKFIRMIVLDEADEMLNMGFREDIETILCDMPEEHQMALFSATMPEAILNITHEYQKEDAEYIKVTPKEITVSAIKQAYYRVAKPDKMEALCRLMDYYQPARCLIFCNTKRMVDEMTGILKDRGYLAEGLHGDLSQHQRDMVMNSFRSGRSSILIATDVAARGIDVSGVDAVFNYDVPEDIEYYVHRIGRTGRAGKTGRSFTIVCGREIFKMKEIEKICHTKISERRLPAAKDVVKAKASKVFANALSTISEKDLERLREMIEDEAIESGFTVLDLAAALMYEQVGDEPEEIKEDKPFEFKGRNNRRGDGRRGDNRRSSGRSDNRRGNDNRDRNDKHKGFSFGPKKENDGKDRRRRNSSDQDKGYGGRNRRIVTRESDSNRGRDGQERSKKTQRKR